MAAAMVRQQSGHRFRSGRFRGRQGSGEENIQIDFTKDPALNVREILTYVIRQHAFSKAKKLGYLNVFVKLINKCGDVKKLGLPLREILICLSVNLLQAPKEVRACTLRVIKHLINDEESLQLLLDLHFDYYIVRSLDLCLDNEVERIHAQKLIRKFVSCVPKKLSKSLVRPLVAIGSDGASERDRMVRASLAALCELTYHNPDLVAQCGGISMLLRKILDCHQYPRINESIVATVLHLVNHPTTRHFIRFNTDLEQLIAPFTDCHFSYTGEASDTTSEDRESRFAASRMAVITVMRSWPGIVRFCRPDGTGLQSLIGILYLPFQDIRQAIVEMVFELFQLKLPDWTSDFTEALISTDSSKMIDDWRLTDGFVANEGKSILPHTATVRPNLVENHLALLLSAWINAGILDALVEVIITSENQLFIRSVILLGELLHLANVLLPPECCHHSHYLPSLMALASSFDIPNNQRQQASLAVSYLDRIHGLKKRGPIPCSLFLDHLLRQSSTYRHRPLSLNMQKNRMLDLHVRKRASSSEEVCLQSLRDTQVLLTKESKNWDWDLIEYILKWPDDKLKKLEDQVYVRFIKRLVFFFKPTNHAFSRLESEHEFHKKFATVGCQLVDFLVRCEQEEGVKILNDYLSDIALCLSEVALQRIAPESVMSALNIINTLSHYFFLFIGRFSVSARGDRFLEKSGIYQHLLDIVSSAPQDSYVKLITSSLHYAREGNTRTVLSKALCASSESGRLYTTKLMRVLVRAKPNSFHQWGMEMLVGQLYDQSRSVAMTALSIIDEACELKENLDSLVKIKPSFLHLGERGVMILCRYMSTQAGFKFLTEANYTMNELKKWHTSFNTRYVGIIEEMLNEALTTYEKTYEGSYTRRSCKRRQHKDVFVPIHLYGQLVQHKEGFQLLRQQTYIEDYFQCVRCQELKTDEDILQLKTALWVVGHISLSSWGISWLQEEKMMIEIIRLAEESAIYSLRGTAFYILGMVASTREGSELLSQYGWESRWNTRAERWPVVEDRTSLLEDTVDDIRSEVGFNIGGAKFEINSPSNLDFIAEEQFALASGKSRSDDNGGCDKDNYCDIESGIHIPDLRARTYSSDRKMADSRSKSRTLPLDDQAMKKYHTLPLRSQTFRSVAMPEYLKGKTKSAEIIPRNVNFSKPVTEKSQSMKWEVTSKPNSSNAKNSKTVIICDEEDRHISDDEDSGHPVATEGDILSSDNPVDEEGAQSMPIHEIDTVLETDVSPELNSTAESNTDTVDGPSESGQEQTVDTNSDTLTVTPTLENGNQITISVTDTDKEPVTQVEAEEDPIPDEMSEESSAAEQGTETSDVIINTGDRKPRELDRLEGREGSLKKSVGIKPERSSSSESSRTSKSRTDSFNTDSMTSGVGSYDSGHHGVIEHPSLSPIASTNSLDTTDIQMRNKPGRETSEFVHPSTLLRRMSNLSRVPSIKRQASPSIMPSSKFFDFSENAIMYTTARDAVGYATLRSLMKNRTISADMESDYGLNNLYDNMGSMNSINRRPSIDSTEVIRSRPSSIFRNLSGVSLSDMDNPNAMHPPKASLYQQRPHTGQAEFMGIALPVDTNMIFEVHEGEDKRTESILGKGISRQSSVMVESYDSRSEKSDSALDTLRLEMYGKMTRSRTMSSSDFTPTPLSSEHNVDICLQCRAIRQEAALHGEDGETVSDKAETGKAGKDISRSRASSVNDQAAETSSSVTSTASDSSSKKLSLETSMGRTLVRKEMIRFVINLSSSVGVKGAEQGLLSLKQKFPKAFQDLCFFSEVAHLLGTCSFRLTARRFIQELFEDIDISKILEEVRTILGVEEGLDKSVMDTSLPEDFDGFSENFT